MSDFDDLDLGEVVRELDDGRNVSVDEGVGLGRIEPLRARSGYRDPFQVEIDRLHQAARDAGVPDEFYQQVEAALARRKASYAKAIHVGNPPSAADVSLGGQDVLTSDVSIVSQVVARWQGEDAETCPVTITTGMATPLNASAAGPVRPFIYVRWGTFGYNFVAEVDVGFGRQFTINASFVEVDIALDALAAANTAQANIGAFLSFKSMVRTSPLIRTRYIDALANNGTSIVTIPPFAVGLLPVQMSLAPTGSVTLDFYDAGNTIRYSQTVTNGSLVTPIPLTGDIVKIVVTNTGGSSQHIRLPFELSI